MQNKWPAAEQEESDVQVSEHDPIQPPSQFPWLHVQHTPPVNAPHRQLLKHPPPQPVLHPPVQENTQLDPQELEIMKKKMLGAAFAPNINAR